MSKIESIQETGLASDADAATLWNIPEFSGPVAATTTAAGTTATKTTAAAAASVGDAARSPQSLGAQPGSENPPSQGIVSGQNFEKGFEQGFAEGIQAAKKQSLERQRQFDELFHIFEAPLKQLDQQISADLLRLATRLAESLVRQQISLDPALIEPLIEDALSVLEENHEAATLCLNPQDHSVLSAYLADQQTGELARQLGSQYQGDLRFEISAQLSRGDIQVKTKNARVEASLEKRFSQIFEALVNNEVEFEALQKHSHGEKGSDENISQNNRSAQSSPEQSSSEEGSLGQKNSENKSSEENNSGHSSPELFENSGPAEEGARL